MKRRITRPTGGDPRRRSRAAHKTATGVISLTMRGIGYVSIEGFKDDVEIDPNDLHTALARDEVRIRISGTAQSGKPRGQVVEIVRRAKERFVGTIVKRNGSFILEPDDKKCYLTIRLAVNSFKEGDKALARITEWREPPADSEAKVIEVIGRKGEHDTEMLGIALEKGFSSNYPADVVRESEGLVSKMREISPDEIRSRRDFRSETVFTIDPIDAKDFDDALSIKKLENGHFEVGVHIADVSHYVRPGTALDAEARERQFSVYLADRTIPMLPPALSDDLASLTPGADKRTFSGVFEVDIRGHVHKRWFGKTLIRSVECLSYEQAQERIEKTSGALSQELVTLNTIAKNLRAEKTRAGAIDFERDEVKVICDATGRAVKIYKKKRFDAHKLVEEFMLLANREVAEFIYREHERRSLHGALIYRIHDLPDREKVRDLAIFLRALGYDLCVDRAGNTTSKDIAALIAAVDGKAEESLVKTAALRTMAKAIYSTKNIGHYGLAFKYYTHFTSPIRRYPDLLVHRILERQLAGGRVTETEIADYSRMTSKATDREVAAAEAERDSVKRKQVEYMRERMGQEFDGVISGVTEWGIYVEENETGSEGLVRLRDLTGDYFELNPKQYTVIGTRTGKRYTLGDKVRFKIAGTDVDRRTMDFVLV